MPSLLDSAGARVASVARAMHVREAFTGQPEGVPLSRLAARLGYGKASRFQILATRAREGSVRQDRLTEPACAPARDFGLGVRPEENGRDGRAV